VEHINMNVLELLLCCYSRGGRSAKRKRMTRLEPRTETVLLFLKRIPVAYLPFITTTVATDGVLLCCMQ